MTNEEVFRYITHQEPNPDPIEFEIQCKNLYKEAMQIIATPGYDMGAIVMAEFVIDNLHIQQSMPTEK